MISAQALSLRIGARLLLRPSSFRIGGGDRIGLVGRNGAGKTSLLLLPVLCAGLLRADDAAQNFTWQQANGRMASASTRAEFLEAAELYARLPPDGGAMLNMGAALLMANEPAAAREALARAERRLGHSIVPGLEHDVLLASRLLHDARAENPAPRYEKPWPRVLFFWHYAMPMDARLTLGAAGWAILWAALLLWRLLGRRWQGGRRATLEVFVGAACVAAVTLMAVFGASGVVSTAQEWAGQRRGPMEWVAQETEETP
ncbi:MAG: hypothetical protein FWF96_00485 [Kiritimatiellaeota bacterium]|nr:hypothetical protein [Kiritimatiellota bacterium]